MLNCTNKIYNTFKKNISQIKNKLNLKKFAASTRICEIIFRKFVKFSRKLE